MGGLRIPAHAGCRGTCHRLYLVGRCGALRGVRSDMRRSGLRISARSKRRGTRCKALPRPSLQGLDGGHGLRRVRDLCRVARSGLYVSRRGPGRGQMLRGAVAARRRIPQARLRSLSMRVGLLGVRIPSSVARAGLHVSRRGPGRGRGLHRVRDLCSVARAGLHVSRRGPGRGRMLREAVAARRGLSQAHGHVSRLAVSRESLSRGLRFPRGAWARRFKTRGNFVEDALARPEVLGGPFGVLFLFVRKHVTRLRLWLLFSCLAVPRTEGVASIWAAMPRCDVQCLCASGHVNQPDHETRAAQPLFCNTMEWLHSLSPNWERLEIVNRKVVHFDLVRDDLFKTTRLSLVRIWVNAGNESNLI